MATIQKSGVILINGYNLSDYLNEWMPSAEQDMKETTSFAVANGARTYKPSLAARMVSANGFREASSTDESINIDGLFNAAVVGNAGLKISVGLSGASVGAVAELYTAEQGKYDVKQTVGDLILIALEMKATDKSGIPAHEYGIWLYNGSSNTTPANATSVDLAAGTTGARLLIHNYGNEDATVTLQHSTDNSTFNDVSGFDAIAVPANSSVEVVDIAVSINRYIRFRHAADANTTNLGATYVTSYAGL